MITIRENGFYQVNNQAHVPCIGIETDRLENCLHGINQRQLKGVFCSPYHRFAFNHLSFLKDIPHIEAVLLNDTSLNDIDGLYTLKNLRYFRGNAKRPPIDFSRLCSLKTLVIEPVSRDGDLGQLTQLETLHIRHYRPRTKDFSLLSIPETVTELTLEWVSFNSLQALPELPNLKRLNIIHCKNLTDLNLTLNQYPELESLQVYACICVPEQEVERARSAYGHLKHVSIEEPEAH